MSIIPYKKPYRTRAGLIHKATPAPVSGILCRGLTAVHRLVFLFIAVDACLII